MIFAASVGQAAEIERNAWQDGTIVITVIGPMVNEDVARFRQASAGVDRGIVLLQSDGGSLFAGIGIGRAIREKGLSTWVSSAQGACMSACGFAWLAGKLRMLDAKSRVGFHSAYVMENGKPLVSGSANALVGAYLRDLGLGDNAIFYVTAAQPESMKWLSQRDAASIGLNVTYIDQKQARSAKVDTPPAKWYDWRYVDGYMLVGSSLKRKMLPATRIEECSLVCENSIDCIAVNYDAKERTCHLKTDVVLAVKNKRYQAGYHFGSDVKTSNSGLSKDMLKLFRRPN